MSQKLPQWPAYPDYPHGIVGGGTAPFNYTTMLSHHFIYGFPLNGCYTPFRNVNSGSPQAGNQEVNSKLPIPRAAKSTISSDRVRASHACNNCRERKAKCTGRQPCQRCDDTGVTCVYGIRKREEFIRQLEDLSALNQLYQDLIQYLYPRLDILSAHHVDEVLHGQLVKDSHTAAHELANATSYPFLAKQFSDEDFNCNERVQAMGFVCEPSATAWLHELKRNLEHHCASREDGKSIPPPISSLSYFQDDSEIPGLERIRHIDQWVQPSQKRASELVDFYFRIIHPEFPVIGKVTFRWQCQSYYSNPSLRPGTRWMAVLNLVFAIAAKHSLLLGQPQENSDDHELYFAKAWQLSIGNLALAQHPDLQQVQVEGLAAFYLLSTGQVNRSSRMISTAIRSALALGLHLRSVADVVPCSTKEIRYRVWWSLYIVDTMLQEITGRPPNTSETFCTTPLPIPYREEEFSDETILHVITDSSIRNTLILSLLSHSGEANYTMSGISLDLAPQPARPESDEQKPNDQATRAATAGVTPNDSLFFLYAVDLGNLTRKVIETLYAPGFPERSWVEMETRISKLNESLDQWLLKLPEEFNFRSRNKMRPFARQRISLGFRFYATKIVICLPCLRHLAYGPGTSRSSITVLDTMAAVCVQAACQMLDLLPDEVDMIWFYSTTPWWYVLHYIMSSVTTLLVELFTRTEPGTSEADQLLKRIGKVFSWLEAMSVKDPCAKKALLVCKEVISRQVLKHTLFADDKT